MKEVPPSVWAAGCEENDVSFLHMLLVGDPTPEQLNWVLDNHPEIRNSVNQEARSGIYPLYVAASRGRLETVKFLVEGLGANVALDSLLQYVAQGNNIEMTEYLFRKMSEAVGSSFNTLALKEAMLKIPDRIGLCIAVRGPNPIEYLTWLEEVVGISILSFCLPNGRGPMAAELILCTLARSSEEGLIPLLEWLRSKGIDFLQRVNYHGGDTAIKQAAWSGSVSALRWLKTIGLDPHELDSSGEHPVISTLRNDCLDALRWFVEECGVDLADVAAKRPSLPNIAAGFCSPTTLQYLLEHGVSFSDESPDYIFPFFEACRLNSIEVLQWFKTNVPNFEVNRASKDGKVPILCAAQSVWPSSTTVLDWLVAEGAINVNTAVIGSGRNGAMIAAEAGNLASLVWFTNRGCALDLEDFYSCSIWHWAAISGCIPLLDWLEEKLKIVPDIGNHDDDTPLNKAARSSRCLAMKWFLARGARVQCSDFLARNPIFHAITAGRGVEILLEAGATWGTDDALPLQQAARSRNLTALKLFKKKGLDFSAKDPRTKRSLVFFAAQSHMISLIEYVLANGGGSVLDRDYEGNTVLMAVAQSDATGHLETAKWFASQGCPVAKMNDNGWNALSMYLASLPPNSCLDTDFLNYLYEQGCTLDTTPDPKNNRCLPMIACTKHSIEALEWLSAHGCDLPPPSTWTEKSDNQPPFPAMLAAKAPGSDYRKLRMFKWLDSKGFLGKSIFEIQIPRVAFELPTQHTLADSNSFETLQWLYTSKKFDLTLDDNGKTLVHFAASYGNFRMLEWLFANGCGHLVNGMPGKGTPAAEAVRNLSPFLAINVLKWLCDHGADFANKGDVGELIYDAGGGSVSPLTVLKFLADEKKIQVNVKSANGNTPLHGLRTFHLGTVKWLVTEQNCSLTELDRHGRSPLFVAIVDTSHFYTKQRERRLETIKWMFAQLDEKAINALRKEVDFRGRNVFLCSCECFLPLIEWLLSVKLGSLDMKDSLGRTPFLIAAEAGSIEVMQFFIEKHNVLPQQEKAAKDGYSSVMAAASSGKLEAVQWLVETLGCDPTVVSSTGDSAVTVAARNGKLNILNYLYQKKCDFSSKNTIIGALKYWGCNAALLQTLRRFGAPSISEAEAKQNYVDSNWKKFSHLIDANTEEEIEED